MRVWIGGEVSAPAYDAFRLARNALERAVNVRMEKLQLGDAVEIWSLTPMILDASVGFSSVRRFNRSSKEVVLHLPLDLTGFVAASPTEQVRQLSTLLCESFEASGKSGIPPFEIDVARLIDAVRNAEADVVATL